MNINESDKNMQFIDPTMTKLLCEIFNASYTGGAQIKPKSSRNFGCNSNETVIFRKIRLEIVDYPQRYASYSDRNGASEISLPFAWFPRCNLPSTENNNTKPKYKMKSPQMVNKWWLVFENHYHYSLNIKAAILVKC